MIPVIWHFGGRGSWCHEIVNFISKDYTHFEVGKECDVSEDQDSPAAIIVVKADQLPKTYDWFDTIAEDLERAVLIVTANEEGTFDTSHIIHPRIKVWLQTPHDHQFCHRSIPWGWTPNCERANVERRLNWCFAGQVTHERRRECIEALRAIRDKKGDGLLYETTSFSTGVSSAVYSELLSSSRLVPCPSGPITVDSFRVCEALQCGAIPLVDTKSPTGSYAHYWNRVFGDKMPFPLIYDWSKLPEVMDEWLENWEEKSAVVQEWWRAKKGEWIRQLAEDANVWTP